MNELLRRLTSLLPGSRRENRLASEIRERLLFTSQLVHDVKNLLSVIHTSGVLILETPDAPAVVTHADQIIRSSDFLNRLLEDILVLNQAELGNLPVHFTEVELLEELEAILRVPRHRCQTKGLDLGVEFEGAIPREVSTDSLRLNQVLTNLLSNAVRFTRVGRIDVRISHRDDLLRVRVSDTGIGIPADQWERIFEPYRQVERSPKSEDSHGLGLALARRLARLLGGDVTLLSSEVEKGSVFEITLKAPALSQTIVVINPEKEPRTDEND